MQKGPSSLCKRGMQGVKRLRGVEIEKEKLKPGKKTFEKGKSSKLATALLSLWAHGKLSAATCRWLAEQAMLDGCTHPEVCDVARAGSHGLYPGYVHRDLMARFVKGVFVPEPMQVPVQCLNPKSLKKEKEEAAVILPHMLFSSLATLPNFNESFPAAQLEQFWQTLEKRGDPALEGHPMKTRNWKKSPFHSLSMGMVFNMPAAIL